jgi:hypothetical protein
MLSRELARFACFDDLLGVSYHHWPIETLPESFSG